MGRKVGIIAYGTVLDRQRLEALARLEHTSASQWIIKMIRTAHDKLFAPATPLDFEPEDPRGHQDDR
jgi:hypothetical protein